MERAPVPHGSLNVRDSAAASPAMARAPHVHPPALSQRQAWLRLCQDGRIKRVGGKELLDAWDHWRGDRQLHDRLSEALFDLIAKRLRRHISKSFPDQGLPLIDKATVVIAKAIMDKTGPGGRSIRDNFVTFVRSRAIDQLKPWNYRLPPPGTLDMPPVASSYVAFDDSIPIASMDRLEEDFVDLIDLRSILEGMDERTKAAAWMLLANGDSLDDIGAVYNVSRHVVCEWLKPLLDIKADRREPKGP